jgi:peptide-methionine (S)-S-oxide reductase
MKNLAKFASTAAVTAVLIFGAMLATSARAPETLPAPTVDETPAPGMHQEKVVFAGGCFWGIQAVFEHVKGVTATTAGYSGGHVANPQYEQVGSGRTGHAESVEVVYDPSQVTLGQLLQIFFSVAHDPTELNRQGPDEGPQYRSAIFFENADQQRVVKAYVDQLTQAGAFHKPIVTQIQPFTAFYRAEAYHQDYALHNPMEPYIMINDAPKVVNLKKAFPNIYVDYPPKKKS